MGKIQYYTFWGLVLIVSCGMIISCSKDDDDNGNGDSLQSGDLYVDVYDSMQVYHGTTLFADLHDPQNVRIVELNMRGDIVWEYVLPESLMAYRDPGMDVELLDNGHILFIAPRKGVFEINRDGDIIWSHLDRQISHDADRLPDGNTIYVFGAGDAYRSVNVKEVTQAGEVVWSWRASQVYSEEFDTTLFEDGWTHTNAVERLDNGFTMVNLRNFNRTVIVNSAGERVWDFNWYDIGTGDSPHEPEMQAAGNLTVCLQRATPFQVVEIDTGTGEVIWQYYREGLRTTRDGDRLPNGNTLILGVLEGIEQSVIFEITPDGEIVWQLKIYDFPAEGYPGWFYKAQRI